MAKFSVRYVVACEFLLGCLSLTAVPFAIRKFLLGGPVWGLFEREAIFCSVLALWCLAMAVGVLRFAKWAWISTILLGLFVLDVSGFAILLARASSFVAAPGSLAIAVCVFLSASVGLVMWLLPQPRRYIWRDAESGLLRPY